MESSRKLRGIRGKLGMSFSRAPKPSVQQLSSKVIPSPSSSASLGFNNAGGASDQYLEINVPAKASSLAKVDQKSNHSHETASKVDKEAEIYISSVRSRWTY